MNLRPKMILKAKGESANLSTTSLQATMGWKTAVDLDLHVFGITKTGQSKHVYFSHKNDVGIKHHGDEGVGNTVDHEWGNKEVCDIDLSHYDHVVVAANIFSGGTNFGSLGGVVAVVAGGERIDVEMVEKSKGSWCTIAHLDNTKITPQLKSVNVTTKSQPSLQKVIDGTLSPDVGASGGGRGLLGRIFG